MALAAELPNPAIRTNPTTTIPSIPAVFSGEFVCKTFGNFVFTELPKAETFPNTYPPPILAFRKGLVGTDANTDLLLAVEVELDVLFEVNPPDL